MARKPAETVQVNLRIKESLRRRLEREAQKRLVSLNKEMTLRLEASFEHEAHRTLDDVAADMETAWLRYGERFLRLGLEEDLARAVDDALAANTDGERQARLDRLRVLRAAILKHERGAKE